MALFNNTEEQARKEKLRYLEDRRVAFAERCEKEGFKPDKMFFCSNETGSFAALARKDQKFVVIVSPAFGDLEGDYRMEIMDELDYEKEEIFVKGTGLNGMFGFGTKPARGFKLHVNLPDDTVATFDIVGGRTTYMIVNKYAQNTFLKTKRRRGDANVVWDFMPIDASHVEKIEKELDEYYFA